MENWQDMPLYIIEHGAQSDRNLSAADSNSNLFSFLKMHEEKNGCVHLLLSLCLNLKNECSWE